MQVRVFPFLHGHTGACGLLAPRGGVQQGCRGARPGRWSAKEFTRRPVFSQVRGKDQNRLPGDEIDRCCHAACFWEGQRGHVRVGPAAGTLLSVRGGRAPGAGRQQGTQPAPLTTLQTSAWGVTPCAPGPPPTGSSPSTPWARSLRTAGLHSCSRASTAVW